MLNRRVMAGNRRRMVTAGRCIFRWSGDKNGGSGAIPAAGGASAARVVVTSGEQVYAPAA